jgi:hypothetical protein
MDKAYSNHSRTDTHKVLIRKPERGQQEAQEGWRMILKWFLEK